MQSLKLGPYANLLFITQCSIRQIFLIILASWDSGNGYRSHPRAKHKQYLLDQAFIKLWTLLHVIYLFLLHPTKQLLRIPLLPVLYFIGKIQGYLTLKVLVFSHKTAYNPVAIWKFALTEEKHCCRLKFPLSYWKLFSLVAMKNRYSTNIWVNPCLKESCRIKFLQHINELWLTLHFKSLACIKFKSTQ